MEDSMGYRNWRILLFTALLIFTSVVTASPGNKIQIALLLDTSNSMDGLIEQAKSQLWRIVNEFALATRDGTHPQLEIALYEYGNDGLPGEAGYIRLISPLTTDLDKISENLFDLKTNGGSEYCGMVIRHAFKNLQWDSAHRVLKIIFIAGNEPFNQGPVDFRKTCREAIATGIIVNTIFCGNYDEGVETFWKEGAELADGKYINIDQNIAAVQIAAPQDRELARLNNELNQTYVPYGREGKAAKRRQEEQDANALGYGLAAAVQRTASKASKFYQSSTWDLVDAVAEETVNPDTLPENLLPEEMQRMSVPERRNYLTQKAARRKAIQEKIRMLSAERRKYVAQKRQELSAANTLDEAIIKIVHQQALAKGYQFH